LTLQADTNNRILLTHEATTINQLGWFYVAGGTVKSVTLSHATNVAGGWVHVALTWNKAQDRMRAYINGVQQGATQTGLGTFAGTPATLFLGAASAVPGNPWSGLLDEVAIWSRELSAVEIAAIALPTTRIQLVCEGDSRMVGQGATSTSANSVSQLADYLSSSAQYKIANIATSGNTVATMSTQIAAEVTPLYSSANAKNIAVLWGGVNDNTDAATMHGRISSWCSTVRALGYRVVVCTEIDCQEAAHTSWHTTEYQALNVLIRANYTAYADGLADLGADARLQDATNTTYYNADKTHLTTAGYGVAASIVGPVVGAL
jgi:lysophospholipase L1-like esterase